MSEAVQQELAEVKEEIKQVKSRIQQLDLLRKDDPDRQELLALRQELVELRKKENRLAEGVAGAAGAAAPSHAVGPPTCRLLDQAAVLTPEGDRAWRLELVSTSTSASAPLYVGPEATVNEIRAWATGVVDYMLGPLPEIGKQKTSPVTLAISGLTKTGKTYTQQKVVVAVLAEEIKKRGTSASELADLVVLRLDAAVDLNRHQVGAAGVLHALLRNVVRKLKAGNVPVQARAWQDALQWANEKTHPGFCGHYAEAFVALMEAIEVPVLLLLDELQSLFTSTLDGQPDKDGTAYIRDSVLKRLMVYGSPRVLWCITGSSMALTWINIADMLPNGYSLFFGTTTVHLLSTFPDGDMQAVWAELQKQNGGDLPQQLLHNADPSPALMSALVEFWISRGKPTDTAGISDVVSDFEEEKMVEEGRREWSSAIACMTPEQRKIVRDLAIMGVGAPTRLLNELHPGLRLLLKPHLDTSADGSYQYLKSAHHRQIVKLVITPDGGIASTWASHQLSNSLTQLEGADVLVKLGENADYLFGLLRRTHHVADFAIAADAQKFRVFLEDLAEELSKSVPWQEWVQQQWFTTVLQSRWNNKDRMWFNKNAAKLDSNFKMLVFNLRLVRNVLCHRKAWEENIAERTQEVVTALPLQLRQHPSVFVDSCTLALGLLAQRTLRAAHSAMQDDEEAAELLVRGTHGDKQDSASHANGSSGGGGSAGTDNDRRAGSSGGGGSAGPDKDSRAGSSGGGGSAGPDKDRRAGSSGGGGGGSAGTDKDRRAGSSGGGGSAGPDNDRRAGNSGGGGNAGTDNDRRACSSGGGGSGSGGAKGGRVVGGSTKGGSKAGRSGGGRGGRRGDGRGGGSAGIRGGKAGGGRRSGGGIRAIHISDSGYTMGGAFAARTSFLLPLLCGPPAAPPFVGHGRAAYLPLRPELRCRVTLTSHASIRSSRTAAPALFPITGL